MAGAARDVEHARREPDLRRFEQRLDRTLRHRGKPVMIACRIAAVRRTLEISEGVGVESLRGHEGIRPDRIYGGSCYTLGFKSPPSASSDSLVLLAGSDYILHMNIVLPPAQQKWLEAQVAKGEFASVEDAVQQMIAERMALEADDLAWARPYVDEARAAVARGEVLTLEEHEARINERIKALKS
jgi:antitoxin ParD1/3/4